jgi:hypothetical protein
MEQVQHQVEQLRRVRAVQSPGNDLGFIAVVQELNEEVSFKSLYGPDADLLQQDLTVGSMSLHWRKGELATVEPQSVALLQILRQSQLVGEWLALKQAFDSVVLASKTETGRQPPSLVLVWLLLMMLLIAGGLLIFRLVGQ